MLRARKTEIVEHLKGVFSDAGVIVVAHYKGLSVAEVSELRRGMRDAGAAFRVTKNTLARIALADTPYATLDRLFIGPTAIAYSADPIAAPKAAVDFAKRNDKPTSLTVNHIAQLPSVIISFNLAPGVALGQAVNEINTAAAEIGLPAKSGVAGGIVAISPGKGAVGVFSPPLDSAGTSVRGQRACAYLSRALGLNLYASAPSAASSSAATDLEGARP